MPVVIIMAIVVTKYAPVINTANARVYICKAVFHHDVAFVPDFFLKHSPTSLASQICGVIDSFLSLG